MPLHNWFSRQRRVVNAATIWYTEFVELAIAFRKLLLGYSGVRLSCHLITCMDHGNAHAAVLLGIEYAGVRS